MELDQKIYAYYDDRSKKTLSDMMQDLFTAQCRDWRELAENHAGLEGVKIRSLFCGSYKVKLQCNPKRIISTAAPISDGNLLNRPCFLCLDHLPSAQVGILYRERYLILCNPMPILDRHFTISGIRHTPQSLDGSLEHLLLLSRDMGPDFVVFYNGARCGASAPDHLHFQACWAAGFPDPTKEGGANQVSKIMNGGRITNVEGSGRGVAIIEGGDINGVFKIFSQFLNVAGQLLESPEEPMINAICRFREGTWKIAVYPRKKHRPGVFYASEPSRLLISPGAIDMSGLIILPIQEHFERVTERNIQEIYSEVSWGEPFVKEVIIRM